MGTDCFDKEHSRAAVSKDKTEIFLHRHQLHSRKQCNKSEGYESTMAPVQLVPATSHMHSGRLMLASFTGISSPAQR